MLVIMERGASESEIQRVIDRMIDYGFDVHRSTGERQTLLGGIGGRTEWSEHEFAGLSGVREARRITPRWKLARRDPNRANRFIVPENGIVHASSVVLVKASAPAKPFRADEPVIVERDPCGTLDDLLIAADLALAANARVALCESGCGMPRLLDIAGIAWLKRTTDLPVLASPMRAGVHPADREAVARAVLAAGADGILL